MFNRIFGQDPRLQFRQSGSPLLAGPPIPLSDPYWHQYWQLFDSLSDIITLLDSASLLHANPINLATLVQATSTHLSFLLASSTFPASSTVREALNCIRILARVVPYITAGQGAAAEVERRSEQLFWVTTVEELPRESEREQEGGQFVIEDDEDTPLKQQDEPPLTRVLPPLAHRLLSTLVNLCFIAGFTLPQECDIDGSKVVYIIWEAGIAAPAAPSTAPTLPTILTNRLEVLRLVVLLLAIPSLTTPASLFSALPNRWREAFVNDASKVLDRKVVQCLLCSLLNTAMASSNSSSAIEGIVNSVTQMKLSLGGAIEAAAAASEKLSGVVTRKEDAKGLLVGQCLQLLAILFVEHAPTTSADPIAARGISPSNMFSFYLSKLHRPSDFDFLTSGFLHIFSSALNQSIIPGVKLSLPARAGGAVDPAVTESLVILARLISINSKFLPTLMSSRTAGNLVIDLLSLALMWKDDSNRFGLVRLIAFLLQTITAERDFLTDDTLDFKSSRTGFTGTLGDFIIISISTLVFTTKARLSSLYPSLVLSITNISSHLSGISATASSKLLQLFLALSAPSLILMEEGNPRLVYYLLEALNNVLHYKLVENPYLVYVIIVNAKRFEELALFTLSRGIVLAHRERRAKKSSTHTATTASVTSPPAVDTTVSRSSTSLHDLTSPSTTAPTSPRSSRSHSLSSPSTPTPALPVMESIAVERVQTRLDDDEGELRDGTRQVLATAMAATVSEKARGKMRERNSIGYGDLDTDQDALDDDVPSEPFVGKNGFVPSEEWVTSWRLGLPLDSIHILLSELRPHVLALSSETNPNISSSASLPSSPILAFLHSASPSICSLLPTPLPGARRTRKFVHSSQSNTWIASLVYGRIYLTQLDLLRDVRVSLFAVAHIPRTPTASQLVSGAASFVLGKVRT